MNDGFLLPFTFSICQPGLLRRLNVSNPCFIHAVVGLHSLCAQAFLGVGILVGTHGWLVYPGTGEKTGLNNRSSKVCVQRLDWVVSYRFAMHFVLFPLMPFTHV